MTMSTRQWEELNVVEGITYNCSCPTWNLTSCAITVKVQWITSWVPMHSLPWVQDERWIFVGLMRCVHTHWRGLQLKDVIILVASKVLWRKLGKIIKIVGKMHWTINQIIILRLEHNKSQAQWFSNILSKNMLEMVWWCICSKMEFWSQIICCSMNCSKVKKHAHVMGGKRLHVILKCY